MDSPLLDSPIHRQYIDRYRYYIDIKKVLLDGPLHRQSIINLKNKNAK